MNRYDGLVWAILFLVFGFFQFNDPDGLIWVAIYGSAAMFSVLAFKRKLNYKLLWVAAVLYTIGAWYLWPNSYQGLTLENGYTPAIEEARESLGLLICTVAMIWLYFRRVPAVED